MEADSAGRTRLQPGKHLHPTATRGGIVIDDHDIKRGDSWAARRKPQKLLDPDGHAGIIDNRDESEIRSRTDLE